MSESSSEEMSTENEIPALNDDLNLEVLRELGSIGAGNAATALSEILQQPVTIEVPKVYTLPPHLIQKYYGYHDRTVTAIYSQLSGDMDCDILLLFDPEEEKKIVTLMTSAPSPEEIDPEMAKSAIEELGNILIGSFLSAIANFTGIKLLPTYPQRAMDAFDAIIDNFLIKQAIFSNISLVFETRFIGNHGAGNCLLIIFLSRELYQLLVLKANEWLKRDLT